MIPPSELMRDDGELDPESAAVVEHCHIYLICRRPATSYDPSSFTFANERISGRLLYRIAGKQEELPFDIPFELLDGAAEARVLAYPHWVIETLLPNAEGVRHVPASMMAAALAPPGVLREFEVLYVGQAYAEGRRTALDRLKPAPTHRTRAEATR